MSPSTTSKKGGKRKSRHEPCGAAIVRRTLPKRQCVNKPEEGIVAAAAEVHNEEISTNHAGAIDAHNEGKQRGRYKKWQGTDDENTLLAWSEESTEVY
jgi:hypothetical protein